jgi:2-polyprenyl-6-hydroxyphenyl methylase / 3-demethylubiquinone-9 3-methyltransferase
MSSVDPGEVQRFDRLAATWWDEEGPMRALHAMNPARLRWIRDEVAAHFGRERKERRLLYGLTAIDIGCGGGLLAEPLARLGAAVSGIDPAAENIAVARRHAERSGLAIDYRVTTVEEVMSSAERFDLVFALEVVEHVADVAAFIDACAQVTKPGGLVLLSTLNRTLRAFTLAVIGAEYVLRWLPRGTHRWEKFVTPDELLTQAEAAGLEPREAQGLVFDPLLWDWRLSRDTAVNYVLAAAKPNGMPGAPRS